MLSVTVFEIGSQAYSIVRGPRFFAERDQVVAIGLVELISLAEEKFQFQFEEEDLTTSTFDSVSSLAETIAKRKGG